MPTQLTPDLLNEIEARANAATLGQWVTFYDKDHEGWWVDTNSNVYENSPLSLLIEDSYSDQAEADAQFVAHARQDVPNLVAAIRERDKTMDRFIQIEDENKALKLAVKEANDSVARIRDTLKEACEREDLGYHYADCALTSWALQNSGMRLEEPNPAPACTCGLDDLADRINEVVNATTKY